MNTQQLAVLAGAPLRAEFTLYPIEATTYNGDALNAFIRTENRNDTLAIFFQMFKTDPRKPYEPACVWIVPEHEEPQGFAETVEAL
jgi:hypothetical protein